MVLSTAGEKRIEDCDPTNNFGMRPMRGVIELKSLPATGRLLNRSRVMHSILQTVQAAVGGDLALKIGLGLVVLLAAQVLLSLAGTLRQLHFDSRQRRAEHERLKLLIRVAAAQCKEAEQTRHAWNGYRKFTVRKKVRECEDVFSFHLTAHDDKPVAAFKPGQYLTFQLNIPGSAKPVVRCYSLSEGPHETGHYRVTIKRALPPPEQPDAPRGVASTFFCDTVREGDILDVKEPGGHFVLELDQQKPVVLISGGVGITPMLSMLNAITAGGSKREVWFFFGARHREEHIQKEHLERLAAKHENVRLHICYSKPGPGDVLGRDYQHNGRVSVDLFKQLLPSSNYEFYICGPGPFMKSITDGLREWGVPDKHVFFEAFGPATVRRVSAPVSGSTTPAVPVEVAFSRSGKVFKWNEGTLLELAEANGIMLEAGCRAGNCGTCLVAIKSGDVEYLAGHGAAAEEHSCLTCICQPKSNLVLDA